MLQPPLESGLAYLVRGGGGGGGGGSLKGDSEGVVQ